jgi:hypothetical protein
VKVCRNIAITFRNIRQHLFTRDQTRKLTITYHIWVAVKREIPEPRPYPIWRSSSKHIIKILAKQSCAMMRIEFPTPSSPRGPYIPMKRFAAA